MATRREFALILRLSQDLTVVSRRYALTDLLRRSQNE